MREGVHRKLQRAVPVSPHVSFDDDGSFSSIGLSDITFESSINIAFFCTSSGSPVNNISFTLRSSELNKRTSAGTISPVISNTISPATNSLLGTSISTPSRITFEFGWLNDANASSAPAAEFSVYAPIILNKQMEF